jgi:uncharacterized protein
MRARLLSFVVTFQAILFLSHFFVYQTWVSFQANSAPLRIPDLGIIFFCLSVSFVLASLLAWRFPQWPVRVFYKAAAIWLGIFNFLILASISCWILLGVVRLLHLRWPPEQIAWVAFGIGLLVSVYGLVNASVVRVRRVSVKLPHLPANWRGRVAALVSDTHLGHVRGAGFAQRIMRLISRQKPDLVLIAGDFFDGTTGDFRKQAAPLSQLSPPHGVFFIAGNHEQFADDRKYFDAILAAGVRVLHNEKVTLDGLQLVGVHFRDAVRPDRLRAVLRGAQIDPNGASILLTHAPNQLAVAAEAGISLQLNGHTHGGQFFPWTIATRRIYGDFVYGLHHFGNMQVFTSYGAGTWGPPLRVGTSPEIVLIAFE